MAESIDSIISDSAFEQLRRLLKDITECDERMQAFIKTVDSLRRSLESAGGLKHVSEEYGRLCAATERLNAATQAKIRMEQEAGRQCAQLVRCVREQTGSFQEGAKAQQEHRSRMQALVDGLVEQQKRLQEVSKELKDSKELYKGSSDGTGELKQRVADLTIEEARLREEIASGTKEFKNMLAESENEETSIRAKAAALANLKAEYETLSESERNNASIGGELKAQMNELSGELKAAKDTSESYTMTIGQTQISVGNLKQQFRTMMEDIQKQTFAFRELSKEIENQGQMVQATASFYGTQSKEYADAVAHLEALKAAHAKAGEDIEEMRRKAGELKDTINDTNDAIKAWSSDTANVDAAVTGLDTMAAGYTAVKAGMAAVGVESEELMNVFAKIQILQQGVNAVQKIANNLTKESVFKTKMKAVVEKVRLAMTEAQVAATAKETAAESASTTAVVANTAACKGNTAAVVADTAAKGGAVVATGGLAAAETAATATSFTLVGALKAVGVAIKSIPVIGWILAAISGLAALGKLVYSLATTEKEMSQEERIKNELMQKGQEIWAEAKASVEKEKNMLDTSIARMRELKEGTSEWKDAVKDAADRLGVSEDWLKKNRERVDELAKSWYDCKLQQAMADKYAEEAANAQIETEKQRLAFESSQGRKAREEAIDNIKCLSEEDRKRWKKAEHRVRSGNEKEQKEAQKTINEMKRKMKEYADSVSDTYNRKAKEAANMAATHSAELEKAKKESDKQKSQKESASNAYKERIKHIAEVEKKIAELEAKTDREIHELKLKNLDEKHRKELEKYGKTASDKAAIDRRYELEKAQLEEEYAKKQLDRITAANREAMSIYDTLNEARLKNFRISNEQMTAQLIALERSRNEKILAENKAAFSKEVEGLDAGSAEYLAIKEKWDAKNEKQAYDSMEREKRIRMQGFNDILAELKRQADDDANQLAITAINTGMSDFDLQQAQRQQKIDSIQSEIDKYRELEATYEQLGMTEEQYNSRMLELNAQLVTAQKEQHDAAMSQIMAQREARQELAMTISDGIFAVGNALADSIEDEKQRVMVQQSLAMAQVLMEQAVAISKAVSSAAEGDPYTLAMRIATAVAAITTTFISARNAMSQAKQATAQASAYAEGTDYHRGGDAIVGEAGYPELVIAKGRQFLVDKPTLIPNLPIGSKVVPLQSRTLDSMQEVDLSEVVQRLDHIGNRPVVRIDVGENVYSHIVKGASQTRILNTQFAH